MRRVLPSACSRLPPPWWRRPPPGRKRPGADDHPRQADARERGQPAHDHAARPSRPSGAATPLSSAAPTAGRPSRSRAARRAEARRPRARRGRAPPARLRQPPAADAPQAARAGRPVQQVHPAAPLAGRDRRRRRRRRPGGGGGGGGGTVVCNSTADHDGDLLRTRSSSRSAPIPCLADTDNDQMTDGWEYWSAKDLNVKAVPYPGKRPFPNALDPSDGAAARRGSAPSTSTATGSRRSRSTAPGAHRQPSTPRA